MSKKWNNKGIMAAALLPFALVLSACGGADDAPSKEGPASDAEFADLVPEDIASSGVLDIAVSLAYPPMEYSEPGSTELIGADIDLAREVAARLGLEPEFTNMQFEQLISSVTTGRVDMIWTAMLDLEERHENMDFLDYFQTGNQFFAPEKFRDKFEEIEDLCGEPITIATGTNWVQVVQEMSTEICDADKQMKIVEVGTLAEQKLQMEQERAVAAFMGFEGVLELQAQEPDEWFKIGDVQNEGYYGIAFAKDSTEIREAVQAALESMIEDGTYEDILDEYGLAEAGIPEILLNAGE